MGVHHSGRRCRSPADSSSVGLGGLQRVGAERRDFLDAFGQLAGFPTSFLISRDGKVCARYVGLADSAEPERQIRALL